MKAEISTCLRGADDPHAATGGEMERKRGKQGLSGCVCVTHYIGVMSVVLTERNTIMILNAA